MNPALVAARAGLSQRSAGPWWLLLLTGLAAISGIFYPITHLPVFLQWAGQVFPPYWLGLGMRSALLPHAMAVVEVGHSWRHLATFGVLSAWAVAGLVLAPVVLREWRAASPALPSRPAARKRCAVHERPRVCCGGDWPRLSKCGSGHRDS